MRENNLAAGTQVRGWGGPSRRRVPRFLVQTPLDVTVLRSGIPDTVPGRSLNVCERGISAILAGELVPGEAVGIEIRLPRAADTLRTRARVRYQDKLVCGLEFVGLSAEQRAVIREWAKEAKAETELSTSPTPAMAKKGTDAGGGSGEAAGGAPREPRKKRRAMGWAIFLGFLVFAAIAAAVFWWRWNRGWEELELGLKNPEMATAEKPQAQVAPEIMEKLLVHRVEPTYPAEARKANLQGVIALDIVVGRDGSVVSMHPLNGPEVLARAAMDALRWWKFEPYRVNGEPTVVETTVAVEFKR
jgi:TonB family protein